MSSSNQSINFQELFSKQGKLDLLANYRGQIRQNTTATKANLQLLLILIVWFIFINILVVGSSMTFSYILPDFVEYIGVLAVENPDIYNSVLAVFKSIGITIPETIFKDLGIFLNSLSPLVATLSFIPFNAMLLVLLERKVLSILTRRLGPNRVGYNGLLQTFVDGIKLLFKEDTTPEASNKILFFLAPAFFFAPSILVFLPIISVAVSGMGAFQFANFDGNLIFVLGIASLSITGLVLASYASASKYSLLGGLRSIAQAISYEIPLILAVICMALLLGGTLNLHEINSLQSGDIFNWNIFGAGIVYDIPKFVLDINILGICMSLLKFCLFIVLALLIYSCLLAENNRIPFDLPEAESELVSGFNTEYSGMKFALFFLAEYTNLFISSALFVILFLGGTNFGIPLLEQFNTWVLSDVGIHIFNFHYEIGDLTWIGGLKMFLLKTYLVVCVAIWIRATLPRFKSEQLMNFAWKKIIPLSLILVILSATVKIFI